MSNTRNDRNRRHAARLGLAATMALAASAGCSKQQTAAPAAAGLSEPAQAAGATGPQPLGSATAGRGAASQLTDAEIRRAVTGAYEDARGTNEGKNADHIPALARVDPKLFAVAAALPNGQVVEVGDTTRKFSIQSVADVFVLARLIEDIGAKAVDEKIGVTASAVPFNSIMAIELNKDKHPAVNPLVDAGAIATVGLIPAKSPEERWQRIISTLGAFAGRELAVDDEVYRSESATNARTRAIAWLLSTYKVIPDDPMSALDLYRRECSVSVTARDLAVMGATLAYGGVNPVTHVPVVSAATAAHVLAVMSTAGLYENSGEWAYRVGVPAKSGAGGGIIAVAPGRLALGTFAPPLDEAGNSVRGQRAIESVVRDTGVNMFLAAPAPTSVAVVTWGG
ncbi:MAG TPA: glutaminase A [Polyangiaceae bacterium]|nr:glutaminase A [Polyangiaceae bacterium]